LTGRKAPSVRDGTAPLSDRPLQWCDMDPSSRSPTETTDETLARLLDSVARYAGWLGRDRPSIALRANVQALEIAVSAGTEIAPCLRVLDVDLQRVPDGAVRKILRKALAEISVVLAGRVPLEKKERQL
jgi:hypothetical protein